MLNVFPCIKFFINVLTEHELRKAQASGINVHFLSFFFFALKRENRNTENFSSILIYILQTAVSRKFSLLVNTRDIIKSVYSLMQM